MQQVAGLRLPALAYWYSCGGATLRSCCQACRLRADEREAAALAGARCRPLGTQEPSTERGGGRVIKYSFYSWQPSHLPIAPFMCARDGGSSAGETAPSSAPPARGSQTRALGRTIQPRRLVARGRWAQERGIARHRTQVHQAFSSKVWLKTPSLTGPWIR